MLKRLNKRVLAILLAVCMLAVSLPLSMLSFAEEFVSENVMLNKVASKTSVAKNISAGNVFEHNNFNGNGTLEIINDGDTETRVDAFGGNDWGVNTGVVIEFTEPVYLSEIKIYAGYEGLPDTYDVFASDGLGSLYIDKNRVGDDVACMGAARKVEVNKQVTHIAVYLTDYNGNGRIAEIEAWTGDPTATPEGFKEENLLRTSLGSVKGILYNHVQKTVSENTKFDEHGAIAVATDGDTETHCDIWGWDANTSVGVQYALDDSYYCSRVSMYTGVPAYGISDTWTIYASNSLETLYLDSSLVAAEITNPNYMEFTLNRKVSYVAFIIKPSSDAWVRELELWSGEDPENVVFEPKNILPENANYRTVIYDQLTNGVSENTKFDEQGTVAVALDGNTSAHSDVYGWSDAIDIGVEFSLSEAVYCGNAVIYSGYPDSASVWDKWRVYASDSIDTLYNNSSLMASEIVCKGDKVEISINKKIKFIAFIIDFDGGQHNARVKELELWTAKEPEGEGPSYDTEVAAGGKKVLTIGNSFSENASAYATEIAAAQGYDLLFGYLKYPSATLEQHVKNAQRNSAVYKFEYTSSKGRFTVKDGLNEFASIKEALAFTDWDIIVLQEGSTASVDFKNYLELTDLLDYVTALAPDAEIMLHETWSWGSWADDTDADNENDHSRCYNIIANYILAAEMLCDGAKVIHSGFAIETARELYEDHFKFNDYDDGKYQHLNDLGKYIAGATYVATIFDCDFKANTFGDGEAAFADVDLPELREMIDFIVNDANDELLETLRPILEELKDKFFGEPDNFIMRHFGEAKDIMQDVTMGTFSETDRFSLANPEALMLAIDGDLANIFEIWGALDWDYPKNVGAMYKLDASYNVKTVVVAAGLSAENPTTIDVYAADSVGTLYNEENRIAKGIKCVGSKIEIPVDKQVSCVAFVITDYVGSAHVAEFDLIGEDKPVVKEEITWPSAPESGNLLTGATGYKVIAPGGDFKGSKEFEYKLMEQKDEVTVDVLIDNKFDIHYDVWNLAENDRPGVMYDLGGYYDLTHLHAWAGAQGSELIVNNGFRIYAAESLADLYKEENLVANYFNGDDTTNEIGVDTKLKRIRYVAFFLTSSTDKAWRLREFAAFGTKSADQTEKQEPTSIIEGIEAEYYGVATGNLADPIYMGASDFIASLTDGTRNHVEFWGGADVNNSTFVFIYNLYGNYDLTGVDIYAAADSIEEDSGIHKGIRSAKVYASRKFDELFTTKPIVMKEDYTDPKLADENAYYSAEALPEWKGVRYIAYVFTIGDTRYGACRLEELKAFGKMSAVQDAEEEEERLPQYIDVTAQNGVVARIFALGANDDLSKLDAHLNAESTDSADKLKFIDDSLEGFKATALHEVKIVDGAGAEVNTSGRIIRLSIPEENTKSLVACVDDFGAEIVSSGILGKCLTVETSTLRSYAIVNETADANKGANKGANNGAGGVDVMLILVIVLGALSLASVSSAVLVVVKSRKR